MYWNHTGAKAQKSILVKKPSQPTWSSTCLASHSPATNQILTKEGAFVRRPKTAAGGHHNPPVAASSAGGPGRPATAPALLKGEGLIVKSSHGDPFLERVENKEVRRCCKAMRQEQLTVKAVIRAYSAPGDMSLYDLQTMHNKSARARPHGRGKDLGEISPSNSMPGSSVSSPQNAGSARRFMQDSAAADSMRALASTLHGNLRHHCKRLGVPPLLKPARGSMIGTSTHRFSQQRFATVGLDFDFEDDLLCGSLKHQPMLAVGSLEFQRELGGMFRLRAQDKDGPRFGHMGRQSSKQGLARSRPSMSDKSVLDFRRALEENYGSLRAAFKVFDSTHSGCLTMGDWDEIMKEMIGNSDDANTPFRLLLPTGHGDTITMEEFEALFTPAVEADRFAAEDAARKGGELALPSRLRVS
mmetsp:Transcript_157929/g.294601  ORF Transcript_157929/g.294601 Transcript_157929/m.294601 type:complete len:414 (+) Transcript_157929:103-1344(+)